MPPLINQPSYQGEVAKTILSRSLVGNQLVSRGLIHILPNVHHAITLPRIRVSEVLQPRKSNPEVPKDAKGNWQLSERKIEPKDTMVLTYFDPMTFEHLYRHLQPTGPLVYEELPAEVQEQLLTEVSKQATHEIGRQMIVGGLKPDDELFGGLIKAIMSCGDRVIVTSNSNKMIDRLEAVYQGISATMLDKPNLRLLMSSNDWRKYDSELSAQTSKGKDVTTTNVKRYKDIPIEDLAHWPDNLIVATLASDDTNTNVWGACNAESDLVTIKVGKVSEVSELMFFKMLFKMGIEVAFGDEIVVLDKRTGVTTGVISATPEQIAMPTSGGETAVIVRTSGDYAISGTHTDFTVTKIEGGILISAEANTTESDRTGEIILTLTGGASSAKTTVRVFQPKQSA